jgi:hypothetical protein
LSRIEESFQPLIRNYRVDEELWKDIYESENPLKERFPKNDNNGDYSEYSIF